MIYLQPRLLIDASSDGVEMIHTQADFARSANPCTADSGGYGGDKILRLDDTQPMVINTSVYYSYGMAHDADEQQKYRE